MSLLKQNILVVFLFALVLFSNSIMAEILFTHEGDSIAYDESNNHYIIRYVGLQGEINEVIWRPPSDINIADKAEYKVLKNGKIKYTYELKVDKSSKLDLDSFHFYALTVDKASLKAPDQWRSLMRNSYDKNDPKQRISWYTAKTPVQSGEKVEGFELESMALPIYGVVHVAGRTEILGYVDYGPDQETQYYFHEEIVAKKNDKGINTAIPLIAVSVPFNPVETYTAFHQSILEYIKKGFVDASIAKTLTDTSKAVLIALMANDINDALSNIKAVKKLVGAEDKNHNNEQGHDEDENDKPQSHIFEELRKILKFNLRYITKKLDS